MGHESSERIIKDGVFFWHIYLLPKVHIRRSDQIVFYTYFYLTFFQDHEVIEMFWEVMKSFSPDNQKKFLKLVPLLLGLILFFLRQCLF